MTPTLQFIVHKGKGKDMEGAFAEDAANYYPLGLDQGPRRRPDQGDHRGGGLPRPRKRAWSPAEAYSLASTAIDFGVAEAVDETLVIYGKIPKAYFKTKTPYWSK